MDRRLLSAANLDKYVPRLCFRLRERFKDVQYEALEVAAAESLSQFLSLLKLRATKDDIKHFERWLFQVAKKLVVRKLEKREAKRRVGLEDAHFSHSVST